MFSFSSSSLDFSSSKSISFSYSVGALSILRYFYRAFYIRARSSGDLSDPSDEKSSTSSVVDNYFYTGGA